MASHPTMRLLLLMALAAPVAPWGIGKRTGFPFTQAAGLVGE